MPPAKQGARSTVRFPIRYDNRLIGGLAVMSFEPFKYSNVDILVGRFLADHVAVALSHDELAQRLAQQARSNAELRARATSMELLDENTLDPEKWPLVCETIARIMQSLTDLRHYQVILFSEKRLYPLGGDGRWLDYHGPQSAKAAVAAIKAVKPVGGTNMYEGLAEAFRFRDQGLDTIYLLSDGLPNTGDGLPSNADKLTETQKTDALAKHVRAKLKQHKPGTLGQAARISGVTPAALSALLGHVKKARKDARRSATEAAE